MTQPTQTTAIADIRYVVLPQFRDELARSPVLSDNVRFGVGDFADAGDVIPLGDSSSADLNHRHPVT